MTYSSRIDALSRTKRALLASRLARHCADDDREKETPASPGAGAGTQRLFAYVTTDTADKPSVSALRRFLGERLPDYMIPSAFVFLDSLPLMPNGKVDYEALPEAEHQRPELESTYVQAAGEVEQQLAGIWSEVLGLDMVGVNDNFFEIGGDSILSIQIIARARQLGIHITPRQMFEHLTIAGLASVAQTRRAPDAEQGPVTGEAPLTPIQHWLLERELPNPDHWNQALMLEAPPDLDVAVLQQALTTLITHHDALRLQFRRDSSGWRQNHGQSLECPPIPCFDLSTLPAAARPAAIAEKAGAVQAGLDLQRGILLRAACFKTRQDGGENRLLLAAHHLAVDTVSWPILIEDLNTAYTRLLRGEAVELPPKTTSYKTWAMTLCDYATSAELDRELEHWLSLAQHESSDIPRDFPQGNNSEASEDKLSVSLSAAETQSLLKQIPPVYNTQIDDLLLTALAQSIAAWSGRRTVCLAMEGHGREPISDELDLSRTVGWFTSYFPVVLRLTESEPGRAIRSIKEQLRAIPNKGIGYGILRYLRKDPALTRRLRQVHQAQVLYNYLGQAARQNHDKDLFRLTDEPTGAQHDPAGPRSHVLEIDAMVVNDRLRVDWVYSTAIHRRETIEALANAYIDALRRLIAHCLSAEAGGYSPADFPEADLAQEDLDDLLQQIGD